MEKRRKITTSDKDISKEGIRLNKYISDAGICSRREADRLIETGAVKVDDEVAVRKTAGRSSKPASCSRPAGISRTEGICPWKADS